MKKFSLILSLLFIGLEAHAVHVLDCTPQTPFINSLTGSIQVAELATSANTLVVDSPAGINLNLSASFADDEKIVNGVRTQLDKVKVSNTKANSQFYPAGMLVVGEAVMLTLIVADGTGEQVFVRTTLGTPAPNTAVFYNDIKYSGHCSLR